MQEISLFKLQLPADPCKHMFAVIVKCINRCDTDQHGIVASDPGCPSMLSQRELELVGLGLVLGLVLSRSPEVLRRAVGVVCKARQLPQLLEQQLQGIAFTTHTGTVLLTPPQPLQDNADVPVCVSALSRRELARTASGLRITNKADLAV